MPEKEKDVVETIYKAVPLMSDFDKGYLYGKAETLLAQEETETEVQEKAEELANGSKGSGDLRDNRV